MRPCGERDTSPRDVQSSFRERKQGKARQESPLGTVTYVHASAQCHVAVATYSSHHCYARRASMCVCVVPACGSKAGAAAGQNLISANGVCVCVCAGE